MFFMKRLLYIFLTCMVCIGCIPQSDKLPQNSSVSTINGDTESTKDSNPESETKIDTASNSDDQQQLDDSDDSKFDGKAYEEYLQANSIGENGLFEAVRTRDHDLVRFLIRNGIDVNTLNPEGQNAIMLKDYGMPYSYEIFLDLLSAGSRVDIVDRYGFSILDYAYQREKNNQEIIQELEKLGLGSTGGFVANKQNGLYQDFINEKESDEAFTVKYYPNGSVRYLFQKGFSEPTILEPLGLQDDIYTFYYDVNGDISKIVTEFSGTGARFTYTLVEYDDSGSNIANTYYVYQHLTEHGIKELRTSKF